MICGDGRTVTLNLREFWRLQLSGRKDKVKEERFGMLKNRLMEKAEPISSLADKMKVLVRNQCVLFGGYANFF